MGTLNIFIIIIFSSFICSTYGKYSTTLSPASPCSNKTKNAWVDIYLFIDVSSNMPAARLRQLTLSLSSHFASKYTIAQQNAVGNDFGTSRISIYTYASKFKLIGAITEYTSAQEVASALLVINVTEDTSSSGLADAMEDGLDQISNEFGHLLARQPIMIIFAASISGIEKSRFSQSFNHSGCLYGLYGPGFCTGFGSIATVNMNSADMELAGFLASFSNPSMNFSIDDKNVYDNLDFAITQTNCDCGAWQVYIFDEIHQRWTRYADCTLSVGCYPGYPCNNYDARTMCGSQGPYTANNAYKEKVWHEYSLMGPEYYMQEFYIGLHRNNTGQFVWSDYNGNEFALLPTDYQNWATGYNSSSPGDCVLAKNDGKIGDPYYWYPVSCKLADTAINGTNNVACQLYACDADDPPGCEMQDYKLKANRKRYYELKKKIVEIKNLKN